MSCFLPAFVRSCQGGWLPARRGDSIQSAISRTVNDRALVVPCSTTTVTNGNIAEGLCRTARSGDLVELCAGEESYILTVRRPEWIRCAVGSRQRLRR